MDGIVDLGQLVTFILVDDKEIPGGNRIETIVDEELLAAADGIIDLIAVMDMHVHGFFFFVSMGNGKSPGGLAILYGCFTGSKFFHSFFLL